MPQAAQVAVVLVTCPSAAVARRISRQLIEGRLAACVNLIPRVESIFRWRGQIEQCREILLVIKTSRRRVAALQACVRKHHPYDVPEMIAWPLAMGHAPYLRWVLSSTT